MAAGNLARSEGDPCTGTTGHPWRQADLDSDDGVLEGCLSCSTARLLEVRHREPGPRPI